MRDQSIFGMQVVKGSAQGIGGKLRGLEPSLLSSFFSARIWSRVSFHVPEQHSAMYASIVTVSPTLSTVGKRETGV